MAAGDPGAVRHFCGRAMSEGKLRFGVAAYLRDYRSDPGGGALDLEGDARGGGDFGDWFATAPTGDGEVKGWRCPEDQRFNKACQERGAACPECSAPPCGECTDEVGRPRNWRTAAVPTVPHRSLANGLMAFYAPDCMCAEGVTVTEII